MGRPRHTGEIVQINLKLRKELRDWFNLVTKQVGTNPTKVLNEFIENYIRTAAERALEGGNKNG